MKNEITKRIAEQYICAAKKSFKKADVLSDSNSKMLIGHFSDMHADLERFENAVEYFEYFKPDFAVHTGDMVTWNSEEECNWFFEKTEKMSVPVYNCIGNHETFDNSGALTNDELYSRYISPLKAITNDSKKCYYYVDFEKFNLRLIVLNNYDFYHENYSVRGWYSILKEQCDWLIEALKDAEKNKIGIIIASHESDEPIIPGSNDIGFCQRFAPHPWGVAHERVHIVADIIDAFKHGKKLAKSYVWDKINQTVDIECEFSENNEFICYLNGHRHGDYVGYLPSYPDQLSIGMTCSGCYPQGYHNIGEEISDLPRIPGTVSEDAINFYTIDRENKELTIVRLGANINDELKQRIAAKYSY